MFHYLLSSIFVSLYSVHKSTKPAASKRLLFMIYNRLGDTKISLSLTQVTYNFNN